MDLLRHVQLLDAQKLPCAKVGPAVYYQSGGVIRTWGPANECHSLTSEQGLSLCRKLRGHLVISTGGFTDCPTQNWYAVACNTFVRLEEMKAKHRCEVNRGLRNCQVRRIDADFVARNGYEIYLEAIKSYTNYLDPVETEEQFRDRHRACLPFGDIVHYWGVFRENRLAGFAQNMLFDRTEANYWIIRLHPAFLSSYAGYALVYRMNEFYLQTEGFAYVNDGWRSLLHPTKIQDFLIRKFEFRKMQCPLSVVYRPAVSLLLRACYPWRRLAGRIDSRLAGLCALEAIRRGEDRCPAQDGPHDNASASPAASGQGAAHRDVGVSGGATTDSRDDSR